jgi:ABC-type glycerol-3-phosphate transport system substrate-binding protein
MKLRHFGLATTLATTLALASPAYAVTELQWWHAMTGGNNDVVNRLAEEFNASQSDYKVVPSYKGTYPDTMNAGIAAFRAGNAPHIMQVFEVGTATMMSAKGAVKPVYQLMQEAGEKFDPQAYLPAITGYYSTSKGEMLSFPFNSSSTVMWYNKDAFKKAGLDPDKPPTNYAEILDAAKKIRALGKDTYGFSFAGACGGCNIFELTPHIWASGGDVLSADGKKAMLDTPQVTDALQFYRDLYTAGVMPSVVKTDSGNQQATSFSSGKLGMTPLGAFAVSTFKDAKVDFGVTPLPGKDGGDASFAGGDEIAIPVGSKNKPAAQDFVKWATSEEAQTVLANKGLVPVRTDLVDKIYAPLDPTNKIFGQMMAKGKTPYSVVENALFNDNNGPWIKMINKAVFGGNIKQAQADGQKAAQSIIDQGS